MQFISKIKYFVEFFVFFWYSIDVLNLEAFKMAIYYNKLWKQLIDKNIKA